jgi:hypothetical protein
MNAVQRLYETQEAWKEKQEQKNTMFLNKIAPFKPTIYSKKPENYQGAPGSLTRKPNFSMTMDLT